MRITYTYPRWPCAGILEYDRPGLTMHRALADRDPFQPSGPRDPACGEVRTLAETAGILCNMQPE